MKKMQGTVSSGVKRVAFMVDPENLSGKSFETDFARSIIAHHEHISVFRSNDYARTVGEISAAAKEYDCLLTFVVFKRMPPSLFRKVGLPVFLLDHDVCQNYAPHSLRLGSYSRFFKENGIGAVICSGRYVCERLSEEGFTCIYLPKASPARFLEANNSFSGRTCFYGSTSQPVYAERRELFSQISRNPWLDKVGFRFGSGFARTRGVIERVLRRESPHRLSFDFSLTEEMLAQYSAAILCDRGLREPMAKHFEVSALEVAPIHDDECADELTALGYSDGESMILYRDAEDLVEKIDYYTRHRDELFAVQRKAREVATGHTWDVRARQLSEEVARML